LGAGDKDRFRTWGLVAATAAGRGNADELGRWGWRSAIGGSRGKLILDDRLDIVDTYEDVLGFEICGGSRALN
jgi:hypothetical protein